MPNPIPRLFKNRGGLIKNTTISFVERNGEGISQRDGFLWAARGKAVYDNTNPFDMNLIRKLVMFMLEGFYSSLSGALVQQRTLNVLANNITNVKTPGFKEERVVSTTFHQALMTRKENGAFSTIGTGDMARLVEDVITNADASSLEETGNPFDAAIVGQGFFNIQSENQQFLTRNGQFDLDEEGYLILPGAGRVLGKEGPIQVNGANFVINQDGSVMSGDGTVLDTLLLTAPEEGTQLAKFTNGLYLAPETAQPVDAMDYIVVQENIEVANYDVNRQYTLMMEAQRAFQACSSAMQMVDAVAQKTATQIASL